MACSSPRNRWPRRAGRRARGRRVGGEASRGSMFPWPRRAGFGRELPSPRGQVPPRPRQPRGRLSELLPRMAGRRAHSSVRGDGSLLSPNEPSELYRRKSTSFPSPSGRPATGLSQRPWRRSGPSVTEGGRGGTAGDPIKRSFTGDSSCHARGTLTSFSSARTCPRPWETVAWAVLGGPGQLNRTRSPLNTHSGCPLRPCHRREGCDVSLPFVDKRRRHRGAV